MLNIYHGLLKSSCSNKPNNMLRNIIRSLKAGVKNIVGFLLLARLNEVFLEPTLS